VIDITKEDKRHRQIRKKLIKELDGQTFHYSHNPKKGDIHFFVNSKPKRVDIAQPDITVEKDNKILVIEIEQKSSPKHLLGVAFAIHTSEEGQFSRKDKPKKLGEKSLIIVLDSKEIDKKNSKKKTQKNVVKKLVEDTLKGLDIDIVSEKEAPELIKNWLGKEA